MNEAEQLDLGSLRAKKARLSAIFRPVVIKSLTFVVFIALAAAIASEVLGYSPRLVFLLLFIFILSFMLVAWYKLGLQHLPSRLDSTSIVDQLDAGYLGSLPKVQNLSPQILWDAADSTWAGRFVLNHLLVNSNDLVKLISPGLQTAAVWAKARELVIKYPTSGIDGAIIIVSIMLIDPSVANYLISINLTAKDVEEVLGWQERLDYYINQPRPYFGGIGRDWASGFTPTLNSYGENISQEVESGRAGHFHTLAHSDVVTSVVHNLSQGSGGLALVGETGTGKTSLVYALAQHFLEGQEDSLKYYQIVSLSASQILATSGTNIENTVLRLLGEAVRARNIIIFLDDARLFFGSGTGALDLGQVLMPLLKNGSIKIIATFTPNDFQHLKSTNEALASSMAVINISEPDAPTVMNILEDSALTIEQHHGLLVGYQAVRQAYRLSGQYFQDEAYPGKGINLLEQAVPYADQKVLSAESVEQALEKTKGIKASAVEAPEADVLLHLEDNIHKRMINQEPAVSAVAAALRRGRAGVANPTRPTGSFLFLGPTGVGKTELARSLAATYFGDEQRMIRLDMSEYHQPSDVSRLLDGGSTAARSLIMSVREQPFSVILLDEIEKAHPDVLNLLLQLLDEGQLTDTAGKSASFKNAIIISTSNSGSADIERRVESGESLSGFEPVLVDKLIAEGEFKAELINRFDSVVLFRPLNQNELTKVAGLMLDSVNMNLAKQNIKVELTPSALAKVVSAGYDPKFGARPMRRAIEDLVENKVADKILQGSAKAGDVILLDEADL